MQALEHGPTILQQVELHAPTSGRNSGQDAGHVYFVSGEWCQGSRQDLIRGFRSDLTKMLEYFVLGVCGCSMRFRLTGLRTCGS